MDDSRLQSSIVATAVESGKAMGSAMKGEGKEEGLAELYKLNQVWYRMPPTLSLVSKRTITKCQFQQSTYAQPLTQKVASAIFNTGEFQISGKTSFLVIQCGIDKSGSDLNAMFGTGAQAIVNSDAGFTALTRSTARALLGQGGIMNIIDEVTFLSASGTEVDRQQNKGLQLSHVTRNRNSQDWYNTSAEIQGYPGGTFHDCYDDKGYPGGLFANPAQNASGTTTSPFLCPTRTSHSPDYSKTWISLAQDAKDKNTLNYLPNNEWDNTHPVFLPSYTGSVDVSFDPVYNATYNPHPGQAPIFIVPLNDVLGMFSPYMNALIPSQALAGGRVEIRFKDMREALIATGPPFNPSPSASDGSWSGGTSGSTASTSNASTFLNALQIYNIYFLLDSFQMNEGTLRRLNEAAAGNEGLSVMFDTWDWTQTPITGMSGEAQVAQARSRILRSFCVVRDQANITNPWANSLASEAAVNRIHGQSKQYSLQAAGAGAAAGNQQLLVTRYQAVLGSLYFPQQPLGTVEEFLMNSYYVWGKTWQDSMEISAVSLDEFIGANGGVNIGGGQITGLYTPGGGNSSSVIVAPIQTSTQSVGLSGVDSFNFNRYYTSTPPPWALNWGSATYGFLAERSQLLQLSGLPISNARLLRHQFVFSYVAASGQPRLVDVFTEYTRVMKVFLGGRIVMRE